MRGASAAEYSNPEWHGKVILRRKIY